jgi:predicted phage terminase large subunit-like protein
MEQDVQAILDEIMEQESATSLRRAEGPIEQLALLDELSAIMKNEATLDDALNATETFKPHHRDSVKEKLEKAGLEDGATFYSQQTIEKQWIEWARTNPLLFGWYVFGYKPAKHHIRWAKQIFREDANKYQIIVAPRESAKTTWALIFLLWYIAHNPWSSNMIISVSYQQAKQRLDFIAKTIKHNERFRRVFPHIKPDTRKPWNATELSVYDSRLKYGQWVNKRAARGDPKSPTFVAIGIKSSGIIGSRISGIMLMDDIMDGKNIATQELRDELERRINTELLPTLMKDARLIHISTRWANDDIIQRQINTGMFEHSVTRAFETDETGSILRDMNGLPISYWPEQWPIKRLLQVKNVYGSTIFKLMYLNIPTGLSGELFNIEWLRQPLPEKLPNFKYVFISLDPAITKNTRSDETAIAVVGVDYEMKFYLLDLFHGKLHPQETAERFIRMWRAASIEYGLNPYALIESVAAQRLFITLIQTAGENGAGKIPPNYLITFNPAIDKVQRSRPFAAAAERGDFFMPQEGHEWVYAFQSQCVEFTGDPNGSDDMVDAVSAVVFFLKGDVTAGHGGTFTNAKFTLAKIKGLE